MEEKVIIAKFGKTKVAQTEKQWRYNHGQKLKFEGVDLPANYEVHFSNSKTGTAKTVIGNADGALIPYEYFLPGSMIYAWVYVEEDGVGVTRREVRIPIDQKAQPTDQQPLPEEQTIIEQAIEALNDAVEEIPTEVTAALAAAKEAGTFDGTQIWWVFTAISNGAPDHDGRILKRALNGKEGEAPLIGDFVYGPAIGPANHSITDLYVIEEITGIVVYLKHLDSIKGEDGFDPEISVEEIPNGHRVSITSANGTETFDVMNGTFEVTGPLSMENYRLTELADGIDDTDAVNKAQVEQMVREGSGLFRGSFSTKASLNMAAWQSEDPTQPYYVDNNDYCVVLSDETQHYECWRYGYVIGSGWASQYRINEAPMTAAQIAAINSGITSDRLVSLEQFKNTAQPKLNGIEAGAQVNKIEHVRVIDPATGTYNDIPIVNKTVDIPKQGATIFDFVYDELLERMLVFPTLDEVQAAGPGAVARFKFFGTLDEIYIPVADSLGNFFGVLSEETAYSIYYANNTWLYEELPIGGGGASNYSDLPDKPSINNVALSGNKTASELGLSPEMFVVTVTGTNPNFTADKTYAEITAAVAAKQPMKLVKGDDVYEYAGLNDHTHYFTRSYIGGNSRVSISSTNEVTTGSLSYGTYSKPSGGIPATDLAAAVQTSLGKAETSVQFDSQTLTDAQKAQARDNIGAASIADLGTVFDIKGDVATVADLPATGNRVGDVYYVQSVSAAFVWLETTAHPTGYWEEFGEPIDLSVYIEKPSSASANQILMFNGSAWVAANKPTYTASDVGAVAVAQGVAHAGEFVVIGSDGNITTVTMSVWQGGSY